MTMRQILSGCGLVVGLWLCTWTGAAAQAVAAPRAEACNAEMGKFVQALDFVRDAQGPQAATQLREKLLPAKLEAELMGQDGTCAVVKYLRGKRLLG
ncbi:hypothetical protein [Ideonella livida]|uniref:Uncharacterized protein n=1 Tax=Ideonella livida TaxID=2707176 RepID=A0A7C9TIR2_9BURK|nr:hypothetical protein [Ideonella livida]NDY90025.1 hypothetical protein [Ideonella livida]